MKQTERQIIEQAYAFFHQKVKVYRYSTSEREKDHIEDSIASYVNAMSPTLYKALSQGNDAYLKEHSTFGAQFIEIQDFLPGLRIMKTTAATQMAMPRAIFQVRGSPKSAVPIKMAVGYRTVASFSKHILVFRLWVGNLLSWAQVKKSLGQDAAQLYHKPYQMKPFLHD